MNKRVTLALLFLAGVALIFRCIQLERRPMHNDEAVNGIKFGQLYEHGAYKYDPDEYHGPMLEYATLVVERLTGAPHFNELSEARLRWVTAIFGVGLVLLLPLVHDALGRTGLVWAAVFTAISPAMVYYSRYYIHEILLVFFTFLTIAAGWRYWRTRKVGWALLCGAGIGLMDATKETFIIALVCCGLALACNQLWNRLIDASGTPARAQTINLWHVGMAIGVWVIVGVIVFSSFFSNASGPMDSFHTYAHWFGRAGGKSPHVYPWSFYIERLLFFHVAKGPVWSEAFIFVLALVGAYAGFTRKGLGDVNASFARFLAFYSVGLACAYSLISYKTPWCLLGFWHGFILLAGIGASVLLNVARLQWARLAAGILLTFGAMQLAGQAWLASFRFGSDQANPYVFAHTSTSLLPIIEKIKGLAEAWPQGKDMLIKVMAPDDDYWPLPWYLRGFKNVGYYSEIPKDPYAPVMLVAGRFQAGLDEKKTHVMNAYFDLRPQKRFELYIELPLWRAYLEKHPPKAEPD